MNKYNRKISSKPNQTKNHQYNNNVQNLTKFQIKPFKVVLNDISTNTKKSLD